MVLGLLNLSFSGWGCTTDLALNLMPVFTLFMFLLQVAEQQQNAASSSRGSAWVSGVRGFPISGVCGVWV